MAQWRAGVPHHLNGQSNAAITPWNLPAQTVQFRFRNVGAAAIELFLTERAATVGAGSGITVNAADGWVTFDVAITRFWVRSAVAVNFQALAACRG